MVVINANITYTGNKAIGHFGSGPALSWNQWQNLIMWGEMKIHIVSYVSYMYICSVLYMEIQVSSIWFLYQWFQPGGQSSKEATVLGLHTDSYGNLLFFP